MYRMPHKCPICGSDPVITQVSCLQCGSKLEGKFVGCRFCSLSPEESSFLLTFIKNRGSIKDVERELGVSYPTVRAALDSLVNALNLTNPAEAEPDPSTEAPSGDEKISEPTSGAEATNAEKSDRTSRDDSKTKARNNILNLLAQHRITADEAAKRLKKL